MLRAFRVEVEREREREGERGGGRSERAKER